MNYRRLFIKNSYVFLTIVTYKRKKILIENIDILKTSLKNAKSFFDFEITAIVILPDHFHILLKPQKIEEYPNIIKSIKYYFSKHIDVVGLENPTYKSKKEKGIWQRRYFEHTIIDEQDFNKHLDYIHYNPVKHQLCDNVINWKYSSFKKFLKLGNYEENWGSVNDIKNILSCNYE